MIMSLRFLAHLFLFTITLLSVKTLHRLHNGYSEGTKYNSFFLPPSNSTSNSKSNSCHIVLDKLDAQFDARRSARQEYVQSIANDDAIDHFESSINRFDLFEPEASCLLEERFGGAPRLKRYQAFGDGPKFVCGIDMVKELAKGGDCLVYSLGSKNEIDYEIAVKKELGCEIHTFDPTLTKAFVGGDYATFHPWAIGKNNTVWKYRKRSHIKKSIPEIVNKLGHQGRKIDMLKIDIEFSEWEAMPELFQQVSRGEIEIDQIQIELHIADFHKMNNFFELADAAKMRIVHKERNHWGCSGYKCVEYLLVSENFVRRTHEWLLCNSGSSNTTL